MNNDFNQNNGFEQNEPTTYVQKPAEDKNGRNAQILGIIAIIASGVFCPLAGLILALVGLSMAKKSRAEMGIETSEARTGRICSIVALVLFGLSIIGGIITAIIYIGAAIVEANIEL